MNMYHTSCCPSGDHYAPSMLKGTLSLGIALDVTRSVTVAVTMESTLWASSIADCLFRFLFAAEKQKQPKARERCSAGFGTCGLDFGHLSSI